MDGVGPLNPGEGSRIDDVPEVDCASGNNNGDMVRDIDLVLHYFY